MVISFLDVKRADRNYQYFYEDLYTLMENAGASVRDAVEQEYGTGNRIVVVCGSGNNGGDGLVAARLLSRSNDVRVCVIGGKNRMKTAESRRASGMYAGRLISPDELFDEISKSNIVVDAILGSGLSGKPRPPVDEIIGIINRSGREVVSIDVPSGIGSGLSVKPSVTVTFTDIKTGMTSRNSGRIVVKDIGIPEKVFTHNGPGEFVYYRLPGKDSHKGMNGTVALVSGWTFYGSAVIASWGAINAGADLVRVYSTPANIQVLSSYGPDIIVRNAGEDGMLEEIAGSDCVLIGPGLGRGHDLESVSSAMKGFKGTIVLDAEGLFMLDSLKVSCPDSGFILTPHKGEFRKMSGREPDQKAAESYARKHGCTVILKGAVDVVTDGKRTRFTEGGNARMTMGGTGDLLAGITASVSTRVEDPFHAACIASFVNKRAGELAFREKSLWYSISDMAGMVPEAMKLSSGVASQ